MAATPPRPALGTAIVEDTGWTRLGETPGSVPPPIDEPHEVLAVFAHLSDLHLCDAESPARQEYLDRHGRPGEPYAGLIGDVGTYRPQEILTVAVAVAMVETLNSIERGPTTGAPVQAAVITGDLLDNAQANELHWYATVISGGKVRPASGHPHRSSWVGTSDAVWSEHYWHPDGHHNGRRDLWQARYGFPRVEGLIEAARATLWSPGLATPSFAVHGNHDALLQGTVAADDRLRALAMGAQRVVDLAPSQTPLTTLEAVARIGPARYTDTASSPTVTIPADPARRLVAADEFSATLHPGGERRTSGPGNAYAAELAPGVTLLALDTVNPHGGWEGSVDRQQLRWLAEQLDDHGERGNLVLVASHHPSWCLVNGYRPEGHEPRVLGEELLGTLLDSPVVVAWLSGHVHHHRLTVHRRGERMLAELTCASCIDWPQQARINELVRLRDGSLVLRSSAVDHHAPADAGRLPVEDVNHLASLSRTLARNTPSRREQLTAAEASGWIEQWATPDWAIHLPRPEHRRSRGNARG